MSDENKGQSSSYSSRQGREESTESIFKQYEQVLIESIISSFGLNFIMGDRHGGDVDTIHNVRKIGTDPNMAYKNKIHESQYEKRGEYNSTTYHSHAVYKEVNKENSQKKEEGTLTNSYLGTLFKRNDRVDLDHVISAKEIHDDRGRALTNLKGEDLANTRTNLKATDMNTNRSKKAKPMGVFLEGKKDKYSEEDKNRMMKADKESRSTYNHTITKTYYTSAQFASDLTRSAVKSASKMGVKEVLGFIFAEIWFELKKVFHRVKKPLELKVLLHDIGEGIKKGFTNAKEKYSVLMTRLKDGVLSGFVSNIITTVCNIFFTTAKNVVKIIREAFSSLVKAAKILFINTEKLEPEEQLKSVLEIISVGASVVFGSLISQAIGSTAIGQMPVVGEIVQGFVGAFVTGVLSCTLLWFFDKSAMMNKIYDYIRDRRTKVTSLDDLILLERNLEDFAADLMSIDLETFKKETAVFEGLSQQLLTIRDDRELNFFLTGYIEKIGVNLPWEGSFESFMSDRRNTLVFE